MEEKKKMIDLTDAWIDWKKTCAADDCSPTNRDNLFKVAHGAFLKAIKGIRASGHEYNGTWSEYLEYSDTGKNNVFHEIEYYLYKNKKIKGQPFKSYLFDEIANRSKGLGNNLTGYLIKRMMLRLFTRQHIKNDQFVSDSDGEICDRDLVDDQSALPNPMLETTISKLMKTWDDDVRLFFCCDLHGVSKTHPCIAPLFTHSQSTNYDKVSQVFLAIKENICQEEQRQFHEVLTKLLDDWLLHAPTCQGVHDLFGLKD